MVKLVNNQNIEHRFQIKVNHHRFLMLFVRYLKYNRLEKLNSIHQVQGEVSASNLSFEVHAFLIEYIICISLYLANT